MGDDNPFRGLRKEGRASVYTAEVEGASLGRGNSPGTAVTPPLPPPRGRPLTHTPSPLPHIFRRSVVNTLPSYTPTLHRHPAHRKVTLSNTLSELKPTRRWRGSQAPKPHVHPGSHRVTHLRTAVNTETTLTVPAKQTVFPAGQGSSQT